MNLLREPIHSGYLLGSVISDRDSQPIPPQGLWRNLNVVSCYRYYVTLVASIASFRFLDAINHRDLSFTTFIAYDSEFVQTSKCHGIKFSLTLCTNVFTIVERNIFNEKERMYTDHPNS